MNSGNKEYIRVANEETDKISRKLLSWLNKWEDKPVKQIDYEYLIDDTQGMAMSTIQGAYKTAQYIFGGYKAEYQFKIIYRLQPSTTGQRLSADETLNEFANWIERTKPPILGDNINRVKFITNARSSMFGRYSDGTEDHQILMTMNYEVI